MRPPPSKCRAPGVLGAERAGAVACVRCAQRCAQQQEAAARDQKNARAKAVPKLEKQKQKWKLLLLLLPVLVLVLLVIVADEDAAASFREQCCLLCCCFLERDSSGGTAVISAGAAVAWLPSCWGGIAAAALRLSLLAPPLLGCRRYSYAVFLLFFSSDACSSCFFCRRIKVLEQCIRTVY